ncbi:MAG: sugar transferase [Planctomycetaceae bacterium]|nr:sugar transferase [Planctomycetaceae bacterium]
MNLLVLIIDTALIYGVFLLAYAIRYGSRVPSASFAPFEDSRLFLLGFMIAALIYAGCFRKCFRSYWQLLQKLVFGVAVGTALCFIFIYLWRERWVRFPSSVLLITGLLAVLVLFTVNSLILRLKGKIQKRIVILGPSPFFDPFAKKEALVRKKYISQIEDLVHFRDIDEVMICTRLQDNPNLNLLIFLLMRLNVVVTFSPAIYAELISDKIEQEETVTLFSTFIGRKRDSEEFLIRALDVLGSLGLLVLFSPVLLIAALAIKLTSPGPIIYRQPRVGKDRKLFTLYKFRTMFHTADSRPDHRPAVLDDERITRAGKWLRRLRLDELPQLINILRGHMSLVGPRPENITRVNTHKALRGLRLAVKPGLTGLAQVRSHYDLSPRHKIKYDYLYIQRRSFMLNLYVLVRTIPVILTSKGQ